MRKETGAQRASEQAAGSARKNLETLLAAAVRAPSGDNTQPWRFVIDADAGRVEVHLDEARDPSPMNAGLRMARIAVGAAIENLLRTANANGWDAELQEARPPALALIALTESDRVVGSVGKSIAARVTNRRLYEGRSIESDVLFRLERETLSRDGVATYWIVDSARLSTLARLLGRADATALAEPAIRQAFLGKVRFDRTPDAIVEEGMPVAALELSSFERLALSNMARTPGWMLRLFGSFRVYAAHVRKLVESASGLCLVVARDGREQTDLAVGRALQRAWLSLTEEGLAAQPMMSLLVLENIADHGGAGALSRQTRREMGALAAELRAQVPEIAGGRAAFLLRFGYAAGPSGRTGRLPLSAVTIEAPLDPPAPRPVPVRLPVSLTEEQIRRIVAAAGQSPSGENCQPWTFRWDGRTLCVLHDPVRAAHSLDCANNSSFLTLGCLLESIRVAASVEGLATVGHLSLPVPAGAASPDPSGVPTVWAEVTFAENRAGPDPLAEWLPRRCTDRRLYEGGSAADPVFSAISEDAAQFGNCSVYFQGDYSPELLGYLQEAETYIWRHEAAHRDLMKWMRFSRREEEATRDGLPWRSLAVNYPQSRVLRLCRSFRIQGVLNKTGFLWQIQRMLKRQVESSAALLCITVAAPGSENLVEAGRLGLRAWLRLNRCGYGVAPMSIASGSVYNATSGALPPDARPEFVLLFRRGLALLRRTFRFSEEEIPVWMFRSGRSPTLPERARARRLPLEKIFTRSLSE